jgi:glycosyltransferase involved in cell wall biosynthesis
MVNASLPQQPPKILYVITKANFGGAQRYVYELATAMTNDYSVSVAVGGGGRLVALLSEADIPVYKIEGLARDLSLWGELRSLVSLYKTIRLIQPNIIHLNSSKIGVLGALTARVCGVRQILFTAHGWPFYERRNPLWRAVAWCGSYLTTLLVHYVIEVSEHDHAAYLPGTHHKRLVMPTGVGEFSRYSQAEARKYFVDTFSFTVSENALWIGSIGEYNNNKNLTVALEAIASYKKTVCQPFIYILIGEGEKRAELAALIDKHGLSDCCILTGFIDNARAYLEAFDIFLFPSKKEGMPYAILEAGRAKRAIIASNIGGIPEVIVSDENGILIDPSKTTDIVAALNTLSAESARLKFSAAISKTIDAHYSLTSMISKTRACYEAKSSLD